MFDVGILLWFFTICDADMLPETEAIQPEEFKPSAVDLKN